MSPAASPNVLLILSDQHHPQLMGCTGDPLIQTPHLDRLARRGTRFAHAYCNFPLCGPSRMSLLTGQYPSRIRCLDNLAQLSSDIPTFAHAFSAAGYDTVLTGRMHMVGLDQRHGFHQRLLSDVATAFVNWDWRAETVLGPLSGTAGPGRESLRLSGAGQTGYQAYDLAVTDAAVRWIGQRSSSHRPFLLVVGYVCPHCPYVAPHQEFQYYEARIGEQDLPTADPDWLHPFARALRAAAGLDQDPPVSRQNQLRVRAAYYGLCAFLDTQVGRVLSALESADLAGNTLVVYTSDHGDSLGEHGLWWKSSFYEGSIGVPLLMAGLGVPRSTVVNQNVSLLDLGPTMLDLAGAPALPMTDGQSFRCLLEGQHQRWFDQVVAENVRPDLAPPVSRMVKHGDWKFIHHDGLPAELYNLHDDPREQHNLAGQTGTARLATELERRVLKDWRPEVVDELRRRRLSECQLLRDWFERVRPPEPDPPWFSQPPRNVLDSSVCGTEYSP